MSDTCTYCGGGPVRGWQGSACWCGSAACWQRHLNATCEPMIGLPWIPPTPLQRFGARVLYWLAWHAFCRWIPSRWIIDTGGWRERFAVAVASWHYGIGAIAMVEE